MTALNEAITGPSLRDTARGPTPRPTPEAVKTASVQVLAGFVLAFFGLLTAGSLAIGYAAERAVQGRRIFSVPLASGQLRFEASGNFGDRSEGRFAR